MKKTTVLFYIPKATLGGEAVAFNNLALSLEQTGKYCVKAVIQHSSEFNLVAFERKYLVGGLYKNRIQKFFLFKIVNFINLLTNYFFYVKFAKKYMHDIFVVYSAPDYSYMVNYSKRPVMGWFHFMPNAIRGRWPDRLRFSLSTKNLSKFSELVAITQEVRLAWGKIYGGAIPLKVVGNQFDCHRVAALSNVGQSAIVKSSIPNFIYVGRLSEEKGVDRLISATRKCHLEGCKFRLLIIGDGPQMQLCKYLADGDHEIIFLGMKQNPYPYVKASDLLFLPSRREALGLVLWEALLLGVPVVATKSGGTISALCNGRFGVLVENSEQGVINGLRYAMKNQLQVPRDDFLSYIQLNNKSEIQKLCLLMDNLCPRT